MALRPIDANELEMFPYSEGAGTEEQIEDWIEQVGLSGDDTASRARNLCWKVIEGYINVVKTQPTLTPPNEPPTCYQPDGDGCAYQCYDGDDEPIDKCKECPLCYSDKQRNHTPPNEWVRVEERLPEPDFPGQQRGFYLVALSNGIVKELMYEFRHYENMIFDVGWHETAFPVTHWMSLPAPPECRPPEKQEDT